MTRMHSFDLDGVLVSCDTSGERKFILGTLDAIRTLLQKGEIVIFNTARNPEEFYKHTSYLEICEFVESLTLEELVHFHVFAGFHYKLMEDKRFETLFPDEMQDAQTELAKMFELMANGSRLEQDELGFYDLTDHIKPKLLKPSNNTPEVNVLAKIKVGLRDGTIDLEAEPIFGSHGLTATQRSAIIIALNDYFQELVANFPTLGFSSGISNNEFFVDVVPKIVVDKNLKAIGVLHVVNSLNQQGNGRFVDLSVYGDNFISHGSRGPEKGVDSTMIIDGITTKAVLISRSGEDSYQARGLEVFFPGIHVVQVSDIRLTNSLQLSSKNSVQRIQT